MVDFNYEWNPNTIRKNWMNICQSFSGIPFMAQSLWQGGPLPWMLNGGNWSSLWGQTDFSNQNWGQVGDSVHISPSKPDDTDGMTPEEKLAAREEKAAERAEKQKLVDNYGKMYSLLEEYGKTLSETTEPKKSVYESLLNDYKTKITINTKTETINEKFADLKVFYNKYADKIKAMKLDAAKKEVVSANNSTYTAKVSSLNTAINNNNDKKFGILKETNGGELEWNDDVDIMELLSTWNSNNTTKSKHIMKTLIDKRGAENDGAKKSQLDTLADKMHEKLLAVAEDIDENKLSEETKALLEEANDSLEAFGSGNRLTKGQDYSNAFDNLYRAIRLAKAEIAEKELKESFEFLGDENPYKNSTIVADAKADIKSEGLENKREVTIPTDKSIAELATEQGYRTTYHSDVYYSESEKKHYYYDNSAKEFKELAGVTQVDKNGTCHYANGTKKPLLELLAKEQGYRTTYHSDVYYSESEKKHYYYDNSAKEFKELAGVTQVDKNGTCHYADGTTKPLAELMSSQSAPEPHSVENAIGTQNDWGEKFKFINLYRRDLYDIIHNKNKNYKFNKESVIGLIDKYEGTKPEHPMYEKLGIIGYMQNQSFDKHNCNRVIKAVMRQASSIGLNSYNCPEYKALADFFGAQGETKYKADGYTPDAKDTFGFNSHNEDEKEFTESEAQQIDDMLYALINKIKEINKEDVKKQ